MNTLYFHPRVVSTDEKKKKKQLRKNETRRATVAAVVEPTNDGIELRIGMSICSPKDQFVKKYGRTAASGIARSNHPTAVVPLETELEKMTEFFVKKAIDLLAVYGYEVLPKERKEAQQVAVA